MDAYSSSTSFTQRLYKSDNLDSGEHTVKIVVSGNKNKNSSDKLQVYASIYPIYDFVK